MAKWKYSIASAEESPMTAPLPFSGNLYDNMRKAASFGYDAIEFHTRENAGLNVEKILQAEREYGVRISCIVTGRLCTEGKVTLLDDPVYAAQAAMDGMRTYIDLAETLGVDLIVGWVKGTVPSAGNREKYLRRLGAQMKELNEYSKQHGVRLNVEVINHYETNIFNTIKETLDFFEAYDLNNCYIHADIYHMGLEETDPYEAIRSCKGRLGYVHVADNTRRYPGSGQFDFKRILAVLDEVGYEGYVSVECIPEPDRDTAARRAIEHLKCCEP